MMQRQMTGQELVQLILKEQARRRALREFEIDRVPRPIEVQINQMVALYAPQPTPPGDATRAAVERDILDVEPVESRIVITEV